MGKDKCQGRTRPAKLPVATLQNSGEREQSWYDYKSPINGLSSILYLHSGKEDRGGPIKASFPFHPRVGRKKERAGKNVLRVSKDNLVRECRKKVILT